MTKPTVIYDVTPPARTPESSMPLADRMRANLATSVAVFGTTCLVIGAIVGYSTGLVDGLRQRRGGGSDAF